MASESVATDTDPVRTARETEPRRLESLVGAGGGDLGRLLPPVRRRAGSGNSAELAPCGRGYTLWRDVRRRSVNATWVAGVSAERICRPTAVDPEFRSVRNILSDHLGRDVLWVNSRSRRRG